MQPHDNKEAFGRPGIQPKWTHGGKDGIGTAYAASSRIWFTFWNGIVTEVYYPTVDRPQLRDLQYLITDGKTFFQEEKRDLKSKLEQLSRHALGYRCTNADPEGRYSIVKTIITDPHYDCVLQHTRLTGDASVLSQLRLYALCAPHLEVGGWGNTGYVAMFQNRKVLMARKKEPGWRWRPRFRFPAFPAATSAAAMAGRIYPRILRWIGNSRAPPTATSRSRANWR